MTKSSTHFTLILKKNKKVLTLVSAGIVLFSFFLKEALSESLKDNLQAAKALIGQYEHFDDDYPARRQFSQIVDKLDVLTDAVIAGHKQTKLEEQIALIHKRLEAIS